MKTQHNQNHFFFNFKKGWYTVEIIWDGCFPLCLLGPFHNQLSQASSLCWCSWFYLVAVFVAHLHIFECINLYSCLTYFSCQRSPFLPGQGLIYYYFLWECQVSQVEVKWNQRPDLYMLHTYFTLTGTLLGRYCGSSIPSSIDTSSNVALVRFVTDGSVSASGFRLRFDSSLEGKSVDSLKKYTHTHAHISCYIYINNRLAKKFICVFL